MAGNMLTVKFRNGLRELELQGDPTTVKEWWEKLSPQLLREKGSSIPIAASEESTDPAEEREAGSNGVPNNFGEYLHSFPETITDQDRTLIAGSFIQSQATDNSFSTGGANELLRAHAIRLANPSESVRRNEAARRLFRLGKGTFRVSQQGAQHLRSLRNG